jgi:hypothetical protein
MAKIFSIAKQERDWLDSPVMQSLMERDRKRAERVYNAWLKGQRKQKTKSPRYGTVSKN